MPWMMVREPAELWPTHPNPDTSGTFIFVELFEDASVYPKYETCCLATALFTPYNLITYKISSVR